MGDTTATREVRNILVAEESEAAHVVDALDSLLDAYKLVTVNDLQTLVGLPSTWQDQNYGWISIQDFEIEAAEDGYLIKVPNAISIGNSN